MSTRRAAVRAALVASAVAVVLALSGCGALNQWFNGPSPSPSASKPAVSVFSLTVGACIDRAGSDGSLTTIPTVPCSSPHDGEVFRVAAMSDGKYPGSAAVKSEAVKDCESAFKGFAGITYAKSHRLSFWWLFPTEKSWGSGDRSIVCVIEKLAADGKPVKSTGTLRGAKI